MQAIILAGGYGTRLAPLTYTKAKPMLPLLNKPMITYLIDALPERVDVIVATNYKNEQLKEYFDENGIEAVINKEDKPLGTAGAVKNAEKYIDGTFMVLNSDIISSINMRKFIQYHFKKKAFTTISLWPVKNVEEYGVVDLRPDGRILKFVEKPARKEAPSNLINAGAYCQEIEVLDYIKEGEFVSMEMEIFPKIIEEGKPFYGFTFDGFWIDVGRHTSYIEVTKILLRKKGLRYLSGESTIHGILKESTVGDECVIGENSVLKSCIVYNRTKIGKNIFMENCIVADNCEIGDEAILKNVVVGEGEKIGKNCKIENEKIWTKPIPDGYPRKQIGNPLSF
ncbi:MAG TPA: NDP-sugar synthase [Thermoplasmatales archaeon]|nr:NDP-sugar synthase [Thermoplasmatales archaeon]